MSKVSVHRWDLSKDGKLTEDSLKAKLTEAGFNFSKYTYKPGTTFPQHSHREFKRDCILSGKFQVGIHGENIILCPGDMIDVPENVVHDAKVVGNMDVILFDATK